VKEAVNFRNNKGYTVLHEATIWGKLDFVKWLLDTNLIDANVTDYDGNTPLHLAGQFSFFLSKNELPHKHVFVL
jgi:ankyrin repeat protein